MLKQISSAGKIKMSLKNTKTIRIITPIMMLLTGLVGATAQAQVGSGGDEYWVDGPLDVRPGFPSFPDVDVDSAGRSVHVWSVGSGSSSGDIFMRRFDGNDDPLIDPVQVNTTSLSRILLPSIAVGNDDGFMVIWISNEPDPDEGGINRQWIRGQAFNAAAAPLGPERLISHLSLTPNGGKGAVAALAGGGYVAVWFSDKSPGGDATSIQARLIMADGTPDGDQFQANEGPPAVSAFEYQEAVTGLADGGFLVAWTGPELQGRTFDAGGTPRGGQFQINTGLDGGALETDLALGDNGNVLAVWQDAESGGNGNEIRGRIFVPDQSTAGISPLGNDFRINTLFVDDQFEPTVANFGLEGFLVAWTSNNSVGADADRGIQGRVVTADGTFGSNQAQLNQFLSTGESKPAAGGRGGVVAVAWFANRNAPNNGGVIVGRKWLGDTLFADSFEGEDWN
jgi:hypothetical protein